MKIKNQKGITLIALVITIIVLLILAGVTISMVVGDSGVLSKADTSKTKTERAKIVELARVDVMDKQGKNLNSKIKRSELIEILNIYFSNVSEIENSSDILSETVKSKEEYGIYDIKVNEIYNNTFLEDSDDLDQGTELKEMNVNIQGYTAVYDGLEHEEISTFTVTDENGNDISNVVTIKIGDETVTNKSFSKVKNVRDSKKIDYIISCTGYKDVKGQVDVNISKCPLTITTNSVSMVYGNALPALTTSVEGLVNDERINVTPIASQTSVGSSTINYTINWGDTIESNYEIHENLGTLTVTAAPIPPTPGM